MHKCITQLPALNTFAAVSDPRSKVSAVVKGQVADEAAQLAPGWGCLLAIGMQTQLRFRTLHNAKLLLLSDATREHGVWCETCVAPARVSICAINDGQVLLTGTLLT